MDCVLRVETFPEIGVCVCVFHRKVFTSMNFIPHNIFIKFSSYDGHHHNNHHRFPLHVFVNCSDAHILLCYCLLSGYLFKLLSKIHCVIGAVQTRAIQEFLVRFEGIYVVLAILATK